MAVPNNVPRSQSTGIPGWHTEAEEKALIALARDCSDNPLIVELGTEYGRSACEMAYGNPTATIYSVDMYPENHHAVGKLLNTWIEHVKQAGFAHRITAIKGLTHEVGISWEKGPIDLLLVDAGHSYQAVKRDIEAWQGHIKTNGVMVFHDYAKPETGRQDIHHLHFEVKKAVDEWYQSNQEWQRFNGPDSLVWFKKPLAEQPSDSVIADAAPVVTLPPKSTESTETVTAKKAASILNISVPRFYQLKDEYGLEVVGKKGRASLYDKDEVLKLG